MIVNIYIYILIYVKIVKIYSFHEGFSINGGIPIAGWCFFGAKSHWRGWFGGTPIMVEHSHENPFTSGWSYIQKRGFPESYGYPLSIIHFRLMFHCKPSSYYGGYPILGTSIYPSFCFPNLLLRWFRGSKTTTHGMIHGMIHGSTKG